MKRTVWILLAAAMLLSLLCLGAALADDEIIEYDIWLCGSRITSENKDDILGDGKARFDADDRILTLDEPDIYMTTDLGNDVTCIIYAESGFTLKGSCHMNEAISKYGIFVASAEEYYWPKEHFGPIFGVLAIDGDFTFYGSDTGIYVMGSSCFLKRGSRLKAVGINNYGVNSDDLCLGLYIESLELEGANAALNNVDDDATFGYLFKKTKLAIALPEGGYVNNNQFYKADGSIAQHVKLEPPIIDEYYDLWLGDLQINSYNAMEIYQNGVRLGTYDNDKKFLLLSGDYITGTHTEGDTSYKIYTKITNLTIAGEYHMSEAEADYGLGVSSDSLILRGRYTLIGKVGGINATGGISNYAFFTATGTEYGVYAGNEIILNNSSINVTGTTNTGIVGNNIILNNSSLTAQGKTDGVRAEGSIRVNGGSLYATGTDHCGAVCNSFSTGQDLENAVLQGGESALTAESISIHEETFVYYPEEWSFRNGCFYEADGTAVAAEIKIKTKKLDLWLGEKQVTLNNIGDILGDGKASYDPGTHTLTLDEPILTGNHDKNKIQARDMDLTIKGSYHMPEDEKITGAGVRVDRGSLILEGDFAFFNTNHGLFVSGSITVRSGNLQCGRNGLAHYIGAECTSFIVESDANSVDLYADSGMPLVVLNEELILAPQIALSYPIKPSLVFDKFHTLMYETSQYTEHFGHISFLNIRDHPILYLGSTEVTEENQNDILGDGKARFDPGTRTLTLNEPAISGTYNGSSLFALIPDLTIKGSFHMTEAVDDYGVRVSRGSLTLDGDFTFLGKQIGVLAEGGGDLTLAGSITAKGINGTGAYTNGTLIIRDSEEILAAGEECGLFGEKKITLKDSVKLLTLEGSAYVLNTSNLELINEGEEPLVVCEPTSGSFQPNKGILDSDGNKVTRAVFARAYNVWLGQTRVTELNRDDILGDGKASYDPTSKMLTLNDPEIKGALIIPGSESVTARIFADIRVLTLRGTYNMSNVAGADYGIVLKNGDLLIDGDFCIQGTNTGVYVDNGNAVVKKAGRLKAIGTLTGLRAKHLVMQAYESNARMSGETQAVYLDDETNPIAGQTLILVPEEGTARDHTIYDREGAIAKEVMLGADLYGIWLGNTRVNSAIQDDIFGDGTASYDPETNTLTLNNPVIPDLFRTTDYTAKIYLYGIENLTIRGSYDMPYHAKYGLIAGNCAVTLEGSFCFRGEKGGIKLNNGNLDLRYGTLTAYGDQNYGVSCRMLDIEPGFGRLEIHSNEIALVTDYEPVSLLSMTFTGLANPVLRYGNTDGQTISIPDAWSVYESETSRKAVKDLVGSPLVYGQFEGTGTPSDPIIIKSIFDWNRLAGAVSGGLETRHIYFQLKGSFPVTTSVGTSEHPFSGIFEGGVTGSIMDVEISSGNLADAPFAYIDGATIRNIRATGTVSGGIHCAGLVGVARGTNLIENCVVDVNVTTSGTHCGGIIGHGTTSRTTLRGCRFNGSISGATYAGTLWGWSDDGARPVITDCMDDSGSTFPIGLGLYTSLNVSNTYYTKAGKTAGTQRSWNNRGKLAFAVAAEEDVFMYPGDAASYYPLSDIEAYRTGMIINHAFYAGEGDILDMLLDATSYAHLENYFRANDVEITPWYNNWRFTMPGEAVTITVFRRPLFRNAGEGTASEPYAIRTAAQWAELAAYIEDGYDTTGVYFEQIDDFSTSVMIGTESNPFQGIYNGGGNTLNFSVSSAPADCAPFRNIRNARISNLRTAGTIQTGNRWAAGLAVNCYGTCAITDCRSSVVIQSSVSGDGTHAGFISVMKDNSSVTFSGCVFDGAIKGSETTKCGGFVGYVRAGGSLTIRNSVSAPSAFEAGSSQNFSRSPNGTTINLENSYYLRAAANDQGTRGYSVTVNESVRNIGYGSETASYGISGITAYGTGLAYGGTFYAGEGETITLSLANGGAYIDHFTVNAGTLVRNGGSWILTMPGEDVRISAMQRPSFGSVDFTLPAALQAVGEEAFEGMKASVVYVPDTCTTVGAYAFRNCRFLVQIRLPKDCEIADTAFSGCYSLIAIFAPAGGTTETWAKEHGIPFVPTDRIDIVIHV